MSKPLDTVGWIRRCADGLVVGVIAENKLGSDEAIQDFVTGLARELISGGKNPIQEQVEAFHRAFGHTIGESPAIRRPELRVKLIREEAKETTDAIKRGDLVEAVDGICDLLYVTIGTAIEFGLDIAPIFDEVHRSNMAKRGGEKRADGKSLKPPGWTPPDVAGEIEKQRRKVSP